MDKQTNRNPRWFHPDVPKAVKMHLLGENHSRRHKFIFGFLISFSGVCISHYFGHFPDFIALVAHHIGYGIHGLGFIPMYKAIEKGGVI